MRQLHDLHILIYARVQRTLINLYIIKLIPTSDTVHVELRLPCVVTTYKLHRIMRIKQYMYRFIHICFSNNQTVPQQKDPDKSQETCPIYIVPACILQIKRTIPVQKHNLSFN